MGAQYPEAEVNERFVRHNPDYVALRRYLVDVDRKTQNVIDTFLRFAFYVSRITSQPTLLG